MRDFKNTSLKKLFRLYEEPESQGGFWLILKKRVRILKETKSYKVWQDGYHAEIIETNWFIKQKLIIHNNPVKVVCLRIIILVLQEIMQA
jgi:hypothetical protein